MITREKAIEQLSKHDLCDVTGFSDEYDLEAKLIAIEAIKKQIPMKPKSKYDYRYNCNVCPKCETEHACRMLFTWEKYCPDCGQAIDWSKGDEE